MIDLDSTIINECDESIVALSHFLDEVYEIISKNKNEKIMKIYVEKFGSRFEVLIRRIKENEILNKMIFNNENDLKFALESFGEALHSKNYELCSEILKYEIKYILYKWQRKIRNS